MIVKRVVIQGFKTYAKKTEFIFDPGVTAVVGPNGSGKSNVADAIRWCLGEQSFSLLRSKKTSDVIFSGSDIKSRLAMAQVSVTLDNEDGSIPVDFSEVEVTRRAYRDGNNEYLLNGQRVRLQDITELLATTGLGKRTYALIGQGLIERVLSMSPDELRTLFEEAAGITTQQSKRTAALRRLEAAQHNLTRVRDITAEISPRLDHLRRQAERTEQRNEVADKLRELLEDWYGYHWHMALERQAAANREAQMLGGLVEGHRRKLETLSSGIAERRNRQAVLRSELSDLHKVSSAYHRESERIGRELAVAQERLRQMMARAEAGQQELAPLRLEQETLWERIAESEALLERLRAESASRQSTVDGLHLRFAEVQDARRHLEEEIDLRRQQAVDLRTTIAQAESQAGQLADRIAILAAELANVESAAERAAKQADEIGTELELRSAELLEVEAAIQREQEKLDWANTALDETRSRLDEAVVRRQATDREVDRLQTRLEVLSRLQREGAGYANGVRTVLRQAQKENLSGVIGTVASLVAVPAELDKAINIALGGALQNVITRSWQDAKRAIDYLTNTRNGRATFLPLDRLYVLPRIDAPKSQGIVGNAADLVDYEDQISEAILQLLGRVWIAEDLQAARTALDAMPSRSPRPTVVTLNGEIVRPGGAVSGGTDTRDRDDSILARERELRELPGLLAHASGEAERNVAECNGLVAEIETGQKAIPPIEQAIAGLTRDRQRKQSEISELRSAVERAVQARRWQEERMEQIRNESAQAKSKIDALSAQQSSSQDLLKEAETALAQAQESLKTGSVDSLQQLLADARTSAAEAHGELQSHTAILDGRRRSLQSVESRIAQREQQIATLNNDSHVLRRDIETLLDEENEVAAKTTAIRAKIDPAEAALHGLEQDQAKLEMEERAVQALLRKGESDWNAAQLARQRAEDRVDRLQHDTVQEFNLVFLDESDEEVDQPALQWDDILPRLEPVEKLPDHLDEQVQTMRKRLSRLKNVNPDAPREYAEAAERCEFLETQSTDLEEAIEDLHDVIAKLDTIMKTELQETFDNVAEQFVHYFELLFGGGAAKLTMLDPDNVTESGIEILARPPGKRPQSLALLSGGERTLAACALIFAILRVSPTPFCVLDEVDAALDEANVDRFRSALGELSQETQFIVITHNRRTLEGTNAIYGVTMGNDGVSRVISLKLEGERIVRNENEAGINGETDTVDDNNQIAEIDEIVQM
ncbi:MAG: chromosome segregation protein SMC [Caldilineaceae bacterium]